MTSIEIERAGLCAICGGPMYWQEVSEERWLVHELNGKRTVMKPQPHIATAVTPGMLVDTPRARASDPDTSHDAADSVSKPRKGELQETIRMLLGRRPMTDEEIYEILTGPEFGMMLTPSGTRTRRSELVNLGRVQYSGVKTRISSGRQARVWMLR